MEAFCRASSPAGWLGHEIRLQNPQPPTTTTTPPTTTTTITTATVSHQSCSNDDGNCIHVGCCKSKGQKCFLKNPKEAFCKASSPAGWLGHEIVSQRPQSDAPVSQCADDSGDCIHVGCCKTKSQKCFLKTPFEAFCRASSPAGWLGHEIRS